jgi:dolichol-phosphate mannosyltransferase
MKTRATDACSVSVIVPTYCEAENLAVIVPLIARGVDAAGISGEIIVVDDNSPDETRRVCTELARTVPLRLIVRKEERGLSSAVVCGMQNARGDVFVVIDADLSHPPEKIADLWVAVHSGEADFVIGSRYVPGGSTEEGWGVFRWVNSKVATCLARPLTSVRDPMAGFIAIRRETFARATHLDPVGYKIGLELMVKCQCTKVREIPIAFKRRLHGESKLTVQEQINYLRHLKRLYEYKLGGFAQPAQFAVIGSTGVVIDLSTFTILLLALDPSIARAIAIWVAMSWNFWLNRRLTFSDFRHRPLLRQYALFCVSCLAGALVNWSLFYELHSRLVFFAMRPRLAALAGIAGGTVFNYLASKYLAFR